LLLESLPFVYENNGLECHLSVDVLKLVIVSNVIQLELSLLAYNVQLIGSLAGSSFAVDHLYPLNALAVGNSKTTLVVKLAEIDMNTTVAMRQSLNDANAIAGFEITDRDPMLTIDPEAIIETSYNFRSDALGGNLRAISWVIGATGGNITTFSIPI
jgi:hypothetical protein